MTDPLGNISESVYDSLGQVVETIDPTGESSLFEYVLGRVVSSTDPDGRESVVVYDLAGRAV